MGEFAQMRGLLEEVQESLKALMERGLQGGGAFEQELRGLGTRLQTAGLAEGAHLLQGLCDDLARSRLEAGWTAKVGAGFFTRLWRYVRLCAGRLEFLEAGAQMRQEPPV